MKKIFTLFTLTLFLFTQAQDCGGRYQSEIYTNVDVTTVEFGEALNLAGNMQTLSMDLYQAQGDTATDRPVVIFCFGGSFVGGSRNSGELVSMATAFAKRGFVCASIDYRLATFIDLIQEEGMVKVVFGAVQDGKAAIRYFKQDADNGNALGINPDQIFIGGTSAGGILAINLAYVDSVSKLSPEWAEWAGEMEGGIEGVSGNPGYCSYPNGVFSFAGAIGDTSYIDANDVPFYSCHATGDATVQYGFGAPLNNLAPVDLYGSGNIETRMTNLGIYNHVDTYSGTDHPPLNGANLGITTNNLGDFLYNILDCNASNLKNANQQDCSSFFVDTATVDTTVTSIKTVSKATAWNIYPNPANSIVTIKGEAHFQEITVTDALGRVVYSTIISNVNEITLDISGYNKGIYYVQMLSNETRQTQTLIIE